MHFADIILKKRNGISLSSEEITFFIKNYVDGKIPDYQVSALLMAIWFSKMNEKETVDLTFAMRDSGDTIDLSGIKGPIADKHSTGGVADTTTLITAPIAAACGVKMAKMSGRGLGHTGGTIDKLESIPGFTTALDMVRFQDVVNTCGMSIIGQTGKLVPADKLLYALRDVTGTVDNISLIASSIMSKKLATGSDTIVLDVKTGNGSFLKTVDEAEQVAKAMVNIGKSANKNIMALVTDMNQPLGNAVGNAIEVKEAIEVLQGQVDGPLKQVAVALAKTILVASGIHKENNTALQQIEEVISNGKALEHLGKMIEMQKGNPRVCEDVSLLPISKEQVAIKSNKSGYVAKILSDEVGLAALLLGAGRTKKTDEVDPAVGLHMHVRLGDYVKKQDSLATFYISKTDTLELAKKRFINAITLTEEKPEVHPLIYSTIK